MFPDRFIPERNCISLVSQRPQGLLIPAGAVIGNSQSLTATD